MSWSFAVGRSRRIARQAARWHAEMEEPSSGAQVDAFEEWLKANPAHLVAYRESEAVAEVGTHLPTLPLNRSALVVRRYHPAFAIAATAVLSLGFWGLIRDPAPAYAAITNRGQATRIVALRDGSIVTLDPATMLEVAVAPTAHHVKMSSGRARFAVRLSTDAPLRVTARAGEITSVNGVFDIAVAKNDVRVWVISGRADVAIPAAGGAGPPRRLRSGQGLRMQAGMAAATPIDQSDTTWPHAHVAFDRTPLVTVLRAANRTGEPTIVAVNEAVGKLRVTGVMDIRDTRRLARKLAAALGLELAERNGKLLLSR